MPLSPPKTEHLSRLANAGGIIAALAMDQRRSLRKPIAAARGVELQAVTPEMLAEFKSAVTRVLSPHASAILLDPEYGLEAARERHPGCGLLLTYEADGFENPRPHRMLALMERVSAARLREWGASGVKVLLSYTPFEDAAVNDGKHALIERIGNECAGAEVPFFLEPVGYDAAGGDEGGLEFARLKPEIVIRTAAEFSKPVYGVDVLKAQVPVNAEFVEGSCVFNGVAAYTRAEALRYFRAAADAAARPFIYLSAGVSNAQFTESLRMAADAGAPFSGVLCGRATWKDGIPVYARHGVRALEDWLAQEGVKNIRAVNEALAGARPWWERPGLSRAA